jgi:outer membrane murein-binding lipoprotein Lpp
MSANSRRRDQLVAELEDLAARIDVVAAEVHALCEEGRATRRAQLTDVSEPGGAR